MNNIGFVLYKKGSEPCTLNAKWNHSVLGKGRGIATGEPVDDFCGKYQIRYFNESGEIAADRELEIIKKEENYNLTWSNDGKVTAVGTGMLVEDGLAAGWKSM